MHNDLKILRKQLKADLALFIVVAAHLDDRRITRMVEKHIERLHRLIRPKGK